MVREASDTSISGMGKVLVYKSMGSRYSPHSGTPRPDCALHGSGTIAHTNTSTLLANEGVPAHPADSQQCSQKRLCSKSRPSPACHRCDACLGRPSVFHSFMTQIPQRRAKAEVCVQILKQQHRLLLCEAVRRIDSWGPQRQVVSSVPGPCHTTISLTG